MMTKKQLQETFDATKKLLQKYRDESYDLNRLLEDAKREVGNLQRDNDRLEIEANAKADELRRILSIIQGEAKPISKYEVIRDLFLKEIKMMNGDEPYYLGQYLTTHVRKR